MKTKYKLSIHAAVLDEVLEAVEFYQTKQQGLGEAFHEEWQNAVHSILLAPEGFQKQKKNFRQILLNRFPYLIIFEVVNYEIFIYRLLNTSRHPKKRYMKRK